MTGASIRTGPIEIGASLCIRGREIGAKARRGKNSTFVLSCICRGGDRVKRGGGASSRPKKPLHHASHGPSPLEIEGRISCTPCARGLGPGHVQSRKDRRSGRCRGERDAGRRRGAEAVSPARRQGGARPCGRPPPAGRG